MFHVRLITITLSLKFEWCPLGMNPTDHFLEWAMIQACEDEDRRISFDEFVEILNLMESEEKRTKEGKN